MAIRCSRNSEGFSLVELMTVVLIIGILVAVAVPLYISVNAHAAEKTCYYNQQMLERTVQTYLGIDVARNKADLAGVVDADHPVVIDHLVGRPPICPSAPAPADRNHPTVATGAYTYDADGGILPCTHGALGPHGHY